jgi:hypothetical protein
LSEVFDEDVMHLPSSIDFEVVKIIYDEELSGISIS